MRRTCRPSPEASWFGFGSPLSRSFLAAVGLALVFTSLRARLPFAWPGTALVYGSQIGLIFVGIIGGLVHASWVAPDASGRYVPNLDTTTILWFTLIVVGVYLPRLQKFGIAGAEIELVAEAGKGATTDIAELMVRWLDLSNQLEGWLKNESAPADTIRDFIRDRAEEASALMSSTGELLRVSFWVYSEGGYLRFLQSEQITDEPTKTAKFRSGEGLLGITYRDGMSRNIAEPRQDPGWIEIEGTTRDYNGLLLEPITWENDKIGVLAIDHTAKAEFLPVPALIAKALAKLSARALGSPTSAAALEQAEKKAQGKA